MTEQIEKRYESKILEKHPKALEFLKDLKEVQQKESELVKELSKLAQQGVETPELMVAFAVCEEKLRKTREKLKILQDNLNGKIDHVGAKVAYDLMKEIERLKKEQQAAMFGEGRDMESLEKTIKQKQDELLRLFEALGAEESSLFSKSSERPN